MSGRREHDAPVLFPEFRAPEHIPLAEGACVLAGFSVAHIEPLLTAIHAIDARAPFRHMLTRSGQRMSTAMTNCGPYGWISDRDGYRYSKVDPLSGAPWPPIPAALHALATQAARAAGFPAFDADACLVNRYAPGSRLTMHQDKNEVDFSQPIVSISLGLPAIFLFGGPMRAERARRIELRSGDVAVWGGPSRLRYHGVAVLADGDDAHCGRYRYNLTLRKAR